MLFGFSQDRFFQQKVIFDPHVVKFYLTVDSKFVVDVEEMGLCCLFGDVQSFRNFSVGKAIQGKADYLHLPVG